MSDLDSIVKGAAATPAQDVKVGVHGPASKPGDPTNNAPNSPSMVYLNLLILEASLRAQFLELRARRRHHTFFLTLLTLWIAFFGYRLFLAPREDGRGVGGSIYWALEGAQKVCFMGGIITAILIWAVGIWERGIRWPRRWFAISNRGLRAFNCKLVLVRRSWYAEALSTVGFFLTYGLFSHTASSSYRHVEPALLREVERELQLSGDSHPTLILPHDDEERGGHEEDLAPGGDYVKLLLLAKPFSPTFRENWELYRTEYWERENERRALLRRKVKENDRRLAKQQYGWLWWLPWRQVLPQHNLHGHPSEHHKGHHAAHRHSAAVDRERKRRSSSVRRASTSSSRSQTPVLDADDARRPNSSSSSGSASSKHRRKQGSISSRSKRSGTESRSVTPEFPTSPLARESSVVPSEPEGEEGRVTRSTGVEQVESRWQR
ncbi:Sporulation-specific protein-like protein [Hapsidospora chrysogenum ATCC 11550]|uniref:Sporulation-specific protein-like protein n=1 Tax=Hapsidospora chrysogenum (strain ATCC 11550 / CBS 779.69 / DSM 880 / IAM 14645 / JCM 23072 / IMI 49137) TaxID=857340 RepID=A0A086T0R7_HAPC1|nr:Sporulation-specific protein-like protein [Hapsidospora chrysogenum ATCC 11550]